MGASCSPVFQHIAFAQLHVQCRMENTCGRATQKSREPAYSAAFGPVAATATWTRKYVLRKQVLAPGGCCCGDLKSHNRPQPAAPNALQIQQRTPTTGSTHPTCTHNYRRQCLPPRMTKNNPPSNQPVPLRWFRCYACNLNPESTPYVSRCWLHAAAKATSRRKKILGCKN